MAVNTDVWGESTSWHDYLHEMCKVPNYALWDKVYAQDWELNKLVDNSIMYCGTIGDFYLNKMIVFTPDGVKRVYPDVEVGNTIFLISTNGRSGEDCNLPPIDSFNRWSKYNSIYDMFEWGLGRTVQCMFKFKINKLLWIPYVECQTDGSLATETVTKRLDEYITSEHTTYPYLTRVYMVPYYNSSNTDTPSWEYAPENMDHYIFVQMNSYFSSDIDPNEESSSYAITTQPASRHHIDIIGCTKGATRDISSSYKPLALDPNINHYIYDDPDTPTKVKYIRQYSEDLVKEIYHQIAFYGMFFLGEGSGSFDHLQLTDPRVYVGVIDGDGYARGDYTHGADNANAPQFSWDDTDDSNYDPSRTPPMPDNWTDFPPGAYKTNLNPAIGHWYHTSSPTVINNLMEKVNEVDLENYDKSNTFGMNPIDGILEIKCIFFVPDRYTWDTITHSQNCSIGLLTLNLDYSITQFENYNPTNFEIGPVGCKGIFGDFRDLEPYTWASFSDAFCGSVDVAPSKIIDKWLRVIQTIDPVTGDKISTLYASTDKEQLGQRIATVTGNCAMDLPINGLKVSDFQRNQYLLSRQISQDKIEAGAQLLNAAAGATISGVSKNPAGAGLQAVGGFLRFTENIAGINTKEHVLNNTVPSPAKIQNGTSNCEYGCVFNPRITIGLTNTSSHYSGETYGELSGFAGYKVATPQSCGTGVHVFSHPKVYISGTRQEEYMLIDQLQKGIYVKEEPTSET